MSPTQQERRIQALYDDSNVSRRNLCERTVHLEADMEDVQAENAKLRELCAGLLTGYECGRGKLCEGCTWDGLGDPETFPCLPRVKARELGVEVDK